jgi:hypothetical protein
MPPTIHLVRHAEGYHVCRIRLWTLNIALTEDLQNAEEWGEKIHDPFLTDKGKGQCEELCNRFPHHDEVGLRPSPEHSGRGHAIDVFVRSTSSLPALSNAPFKPAKLYLLPP